VGREKKVRKIEKEKRNREERSVDYIKKYKNTLGLKNHK
jgi:hypothetical protein